MGEVVVIFFLESIPTLFYKLTEGLSNLCKTESIITTYSIYGVKPIVLLVLVSSLVYI